MGLVAGFSSHGLFFFPFFFQIEGLELCCLILSFRKDWIFPGTSSRKGKALISRLFLLQKSTLHFSVKKKVLPNYHGVDARSSGFAKKETNADGRQVELICKAPSCPRNGKK